MSGSSRKKGPDQGRKGAPACNDPVLAALRDAEERYREMYLAPEQASAAGQHELARARKRVERLTQDLAAERRELEQERTQRPARTRYRCGARGRTEGCPPVTV